MQNLRTAHIALACFLLLVVVFGACGEWVNPWLSFDRSEIESGQLWRVFTGHLVHSNTYHMLINLAVFLPVVYLFGESMTSTRWLFCFLVLCFFDSLGLYIFSPWLENYVGLSGVLYGLLILGLLNSFRQSRVIYGLVTLAVGAKIVWEQLPGYDVNFLRSKIDATVIVDAHLYGFLGGLALFFTFTLWDARMGKDLMKTNGT